MNRLSFKDRARILSCIVEGHSFSALQRRTGFSRDKVILGLAELHAGLAGSMQEEHAPAELVTRAGKFATRYKRTDAQLWSHALTVLHAHDFFCLKRGRSLEKLVAMAEPDEIADSK